LDSRRARRKDERDTQRFWLSVLEALRGTSAGGALVRELTVAPDLDGWTIVERLIEDLAPLDERTWLVIDDLDELRSDEATQQLECFVKCSPRNLQFALSSRTDLHLGSHRLRVDGELTEIRTPDLRFTESEARALFESAGVRLSDVALKQLLQRTEGWAGGLQLAAMSLATHDDPERFASEFSGSERTVAGYLLAEVLERQPAEVREVLLYTSLIERVSGPLADHLTGGSGAEGILHELEDANAFVTAVDAGRSWFQVPLPPPICRPVAAGAPADVSGDRGSAAPGDLRLVRAGGLRGRGGPPRTAGARLAPRRTSAS
jgi:LuxR family transcriptional regulator, maltose regulon positive regulatory protein